MLLPCWERAIELSCVCWLANTYKCNSSWAPVTKRSLQNIELLRESQYFRNWPWSFKKSELIHWNKYKASFGAKCKLLKMVRAQKKGAQLRSTWARAPAPASCFTVTSASCEQWGPARVSTCKTVFEEWSYEEVLWCRTSASSITLT